MSAPLKTVESTSDLPSLLHAIGEGAKDAARALAWAPTARKDAALSAMAAAIRARQREIMTANQQDLTDAKASGANAAFLDRLALDDERIGAMAEGIDVVHALPDPIGA